MAVAALAGSAGQVMPALTRSNVDWLKARFRERLGNPYVYAGVWSPTNKRQGCDCSALAAHVLNGVLRGPSMTWQRVDQATGAWITTESWRPVEVGQRGPFGTITVARPADIPADAAVKIALHHGPGGGANSHMWLECDGTRMESAGSKGCVTAPAAWPIDHSYGNDWAYLPGPIGGPVTPPTPPIPELGPGSTGDPVKRLQQGLRRVFPAYSRGVPISGVYGPETVTAVKEFQRRAAVTVDGIVGPETSAALTRYGITLAGAPAPARLPAELTDRELLEQIWQQLRGPAGAGWPQLGTDDDGNHLTLVDAIAALSIRGGAS